MGVQRDSTRVKELALHLADPGLNPSITDSPSCTVGSLWNRVRTPSTALSTPPSTAEHGSNLSPPPAPKPKTKQVNLNVYKIAEITKELTKWF